MRKRLWFSIGMSTAGAAMLTAAVLASPAASHPNASAKTGGTINFAHSGGDYDNLDPAIAYVSDDWTLMFVTDLTLMHTPDKPPPAGTIIQPDGASSYTVSKNGKTYTFKIRAGQRFSDGKPVTAANFKAAFDRDADPAMNSPVAAFLGGVVGFNDVLNKKSKSVSGVTAKGMTLTIKLTIPDGGLLNKVALPFLQAIPVNMAHDPNGIQVYPSAGPYYIASRTVNRQVIVKRNPYYKGSRPHNADQFNVTVNTDQQQTYLQVRSGQYAYDLGAGTPTTQYATLVKEFGINKGRFYINPATLTWYLALNTVRGGTTNVGLRKAISTAIDRPGLTRGLGYLGAKRYTTLLPPVLNGGHINILYPIRGANPKAAKKLLPSSGCGNLDLWSTTSTNGQYVAQLVKYELTQIGCNVTVKSFQGSSIYTAAGTKGAAFNVMRSGWIADYPDPYDDYHLLMDGSTIVETNNTNFSYFNNAGVNKGIAAANLLGGSARLNAYNALDVATFKNFAPMAVYSLGNANDFIAPNVGGYVYAPFIASLDLATLFLK